MKEVPGVNVLYVGSQEDMAKYFDGFREAAERRAADDKYAITERKLARREVYCWAEAARIVRATKLVLPPPVPKERVKTIVPAPKEALHG
jgi:hypothetical protein